MSRRTTSLPQFSLGTIMLLVTMAAICLAVLRISTFFGVIALLLAAPSLARTAIMGRARLQRGERLDHYDKLEHFGESIAVSMLSYVAAIAAAFGLYISLFVLGCVIVALVPSDLSFVPAWPVLIIVAAVIVVGTVAMFMYVLWKLTAPYMAREGDDDHGKSSGNTDPR